MAASTDEVEVVQFNERFCGRKTTTKKAVDDADPKQNRSKAEQNEKVFNIKRARYEVIRFGISGFDKERKLSSKIAMAIRLGAKPPKKPNINYKELMEEKKKQKAMQENEKGNRFTLQPLKQRKKRKKKKLKHQPGALV